MIDIGKTIKIMLVSEGKSMKSVVNSAKGTQLDIPSESTICTQIRTKRLRLQTFLHIADMLGYEVVVRKKMQ